MNLMNHNLVWRGLAQYNTDILYILGRIMERGKQYTIRGVQQLPPWDQNITSSISWWQQYHVHNLENRGESLTKFGLHIPSLGLLGPMMYPPTGWGTCSGRYMFSRPQTNPPALHHTRGGIPRDILVTGCGDLDPPPHAYLRAQGGRGSWRIRVDHCSPGQDNTRRMSFKCTSQFYCFLIRHIPLAIHPTPL